MTKGRVLDTDTLISLIEAHKKKGELVVFTNGCFDILHVGHVRYLSEAKESGDILIVGLNSDASVRGLKGEGRPVQTEEDRAEILVSLRFVDYVVIFDEETPLNLIMALMPDVLVKGEDWEEGDIVGAREVTSWGGRVVRARLVPGSSTTTIIERLKK